MAVGAREAEPLARIVGRRHRDASAIRSGRIGSWLGGADFTYATSHFRGDKNFLVGVWGLATGRDDLGSDSTAHGFKIDYPNDLWDIGADLQAHRPRLRSVASASCRVAAVQLWNCERDFSPRFARGPIQQMFYEFEPFARDRSVGPMGELSGVLGADQLAVPQRRSRRVQRQSRPASGSRSRSRSPTACLSRRARTSGCGTASKPARRRSGGSTRRSRGGSAASTTATLDQYQWTGAWNPTAARHGRVHRRAQRRSARDGRLHADGGRHPAADQRLARSVDRRATCSTTPTANRSGRTRDCAGRSGRSPTCSSSTTTT